MASGLPAGFDWQQPSLAVVTETIGRRLAEAGVSEQQPVAGVIGMARLPGDTSGADEPTARSGAGVACVGVACVEIVSVVMIVASHRFRRREPELQT